MSYRAKSIRALLTSGAILASLLSANAVASSDRATSFTLKWNAVEGASHYLLEEKQSDGSWKGVHEQQTSELTSTINKSSHGKYTYRVSGCIEDSGKTVHCGEEVAEYSAPLTVDTQSNDPAPHVFEFATSYDTNLLSLPDYDSKEGHILLPTAGEFRVDESGNATYTVPFDVPAGPGGVRPQLALSYSSANKRLGAAGIGWSLSGISAITRCAKSHYYDDLGGDYVKDVQLDNTDALCVDGQRLIKVAGGVFRTEQDSFTEYEIIGSMDSITGFKVTNKAGEIHYYGNVNNASSAIQFVSSVLTNERAVANTWLRSSIVDMYDNTIRYDYQSPSNDLDKEILLDTVSYGVTSIKLHYQNTSEPMFGYRFGVPYEKTQVLDKVEISNNNKALRKYELTYKDQADARYLSKMVVCQFDTCAKPVNFGWTDDAFRQGILSYSENRKRNFAMGAPDYVKNTVVADLYGDGYSDIVYYNGRGTWKVQYGRDLGTDSITLPNQDEGYIPKTITGDFNGDGRADILISSRTKDKQVSWYLLHQQGDITNVTECPVYDEEFNRDALAPSPASLQDDCNTRPKVGELLYEKVTALSGENREIKAADIDGDGLLDVVYTSAVGTVSYRLNTLNISGAVGFGARQTALRDTDFDSPLAVTYSAAYGIHEVSVGDINGDGLSDLIIDVDVYTREDGSGDVLGYELYHAINQGNGQFVLSLSKTIKSSNGFDNKQLADFNGDGLMDLSYHSGGKWFVLLSNGTGFEPVIEAFSGTSLDKNTLIVANLDNDMKAEVISFANPRAGQIYHFDAHNQSFVSKSGLGFQRKDTDTEKDSLLLGDFNGDGGVDWLRIRYTQDDVSADILEQQPRGALARTIHTIWSTSNETTINYKPLTDEEVYEGRVEAQFPIISAKGPSYVVAKVRSTNVTSGINGHNNKSSVQYKYANMAFHGQGRGYLGFGNISTIDSRDDNYDMVTTTFYHQGFDSKQHVKSHLVQPELVGMPVYTEQKMVNKHNREDVIVLSQSTNRYTVKATQSKQDPAVLRSPYFTYINQSIEKSYFLNGGTSGLDYSAGGLKSTTTTTQSYDTDGNLASSLITTQSADGTSFKTLTQNEYTPTPSRCNTLGSSEQGFSQSYSRYGRLTCSVVTKTNGDGQSDTRKSQFAYNQDGVLYKEVINAQSAQQAVITTYGFDKYGNRNLTTVSGKSLSPAGNYSDLPQYGGNITRTSRVNYDQATGRFITSKSNTLGQMVCFDVDLHTGWIKSETSNVTNCQDTSAGLTTHYRYNKFGQLTAKQSPSGHITLIGHYSSSTNPGGTVEITRTSAKKRTEVHYDKMGRPSLQVSSGPDNQLSVVKTEYDQYGRNFRTSVTLDSKRAPTADEWQTSEFDILGRVIETKAPSFNGAILSVSTRYSGLTINEVHDSGAQQIRKSKTYNIAGELVSTTDNSDGVAGATPSRISYDYDAYGQLENTTDSGNNQVTIAHDVLGKKIKTVDPDKGTWEYRYNAFGELKWQKDANGQITWVNYDQLGRVIQQISNAQSVNAQSRCFAYDEMGYGTTSAEWVMAGHSCNNAATLHQKSYVYDELLRPQSVLTESWVDGNHVAQTQHTYYDKLGRVYLNQLSNNYAVGYEYDIYGYQVAKFGLRYNTLSGQVEKTELSRITSRNYRGQVTEVSYLGGQSQTYFYDKDTGLSSGMSTSGISNALNPSAAMLSTHYQYNAFGQLEQRKINGLYDRESTENFSYDGLNRLKHATQSYAGITKNTYYCYDALGNMTTKGSTTACASGQGHFTYGNASRNKGNAGVHALYKDTRTGKTFNYDNNGNMTNDGERYLTYSGFDKVTHIRQSGNMEVNFRYGAGQSRYYRKDIYLNGQEQTADKEDSETFYYGAFERISKASGTIYQYTVGNMLISENLSTGELTHKLMVKDHLGSTLAISEINDAKTSAKITQAFRYDPFGQQHVLEVSQFSVFTAYMRHGFTGHEMLNGLNIIHMNGRIYDPTLGRFLQADPFIQAPGNSQSYNRYSYVWNNPLSYTDPSGYFVKWIMKKSGSTALLRAIGKVPILNAIVQIGLNFIPGCQVWCTAVYNAAQTYAMTGSLGAGLRAGAIAAAQSWALGQIGDSAGWGKAGSAKNIFANAMVGGIAAELQGGKFGHGFVSAGVASAFKPLLGDIGGDNSANSAVNRGDIAALDMYKIHRIVGAAVVGGTASVLSGGKFANGAVTGAFTQMFNAETNYQKKATHNMIQSLIDKGDPASKQQAINLAVKHFDIDLKYKGKFHYPKYDPSISTYGEIDNGILIGDGAFRSVGFLGSTIFHEMGHIRLDSVTGSEYQGQTLYMMEVKLYNLELEAAARFGLSNSEIDIIEGNKATYCSYITAAHKQEYSVSC